MNNIVESFSKWNGKRKRGDRHALMTSLGWVVWKFIYPDNGKPMKQVTEKLEELNHFTGKYYHVVTVPSKDTYGGTYYIAYWKEIAQRCGTKDNNLS